MFLGHHVHSLDEKGRVSLPVQFRRVVQGSGAERVILTRSPEAAGCIWGFSPESWQHKVIDKLAQRPMLDREVAAFTRLIVGNASEVPIDAQGRILLPPNLRLHAGLTRDAIFSGRIDIFEIWQAERWQEAQTRSEELLQAEVGSLSGLV